MVCPFASYGPTAETKNLTKEKYGRTDNKGNTYYMSRPYSWRDILFPIKLVTDNFEYAPHV